MWLWAEEEWHRLRELRRGHVQDRDGHGNILLRIVPVQQQQRGWQ
jgi:hypothetical protein